MASANVQFQGGLMVSPLSENSNQNNEICISYLNSTLSEFLVKLNRPANTNNVGLLKYWFYCAVENIVMVTLLLDWVQ
jgi:hypothetical protein